MQKFLIYMSVRISSIEKISKDVIKLTFLGSSFFIRTYYLQEKTPHEFYPDMEISDEFFLDLEQASYCYNADHYASSLLDRCEQSRFGLTQKLIKKGHSSIYINKALDYLEAKGYLSDSRYAISWIRNRMIAHAEGKSKLLSLLCARGINKHIATQAIQEYFLENDEEVIFLKALKKLKKKKLNNQILIQKLMKLGFSWNIIKKYLDSSIDF